MFPSKPSPKAPATAKVDPKARLDSKRRTLKNIAAFARKNMATRLKAKYTPKPLAPEAPVEPESDQLDPETLAALEALVGSHKPEEE